MATDLFGEKPEKAKKAKKVGDADVTACVDRFHDKFKDRFGFKPKIHGGKDGKHMKDLLGAWADEGGKKVVFELIDEFLTTRDPRVLRSDYTIGAFFNLAQYLRLKDVRSDDRTMSNRDAIHRASKPKP